MLKNYLIIILCLSSGCFYIGKDQYDDVVSRPNYDWSIRDELTVLVAPVSHNLLDFRTNIKVIATPYYPSVVLAIQRNAQRINHWTEEEFRRNTEELLKDNVGMYIDWEKNKFVDGHGNYFRSHLQIDSLMYLITIENKSWPCNSMARVSINPGGMPTPMMIPLVAPDQCYIPDITNVENKIFLINDKGEFIKPKYVWGKRNNVLTMPETMFAMFHFRSGTHHFLEGSEKMYLLIKGFETDIKLTFPLWMMR